VASRPLPGPDPSVSLADHRKVWENADALVLAGGKTIEGSVEPLSCPFIAV